MPDMAKKISDTISDMFQIRPSFRPKSAALAKMFHEYYLLTKEDGGIQPCEASSAVNDVTSSSTPDGTLQSRLQSISKLLADRLIFPKSNFLENNIRQTWNFATNRLWKTAVLTKDVGYYSTLYKA
jgi:hypothetical protein